MRNFALFLGLILISSCELFESKEERVEKRFQQEKNAIDFNAVDKYPMFEECDEYADKPNQRACFQQAMLLRFADTLSSLNLTSEKDFNDTLIVDFKIDEDGFITIYEIKENSSVKDAFPGLEEEISKRLNDITTVAPAIKRATPVSIKLRLPIVLNTAE